MIYVSKYKYSITEATLIITGEVLSAKYHDELVECPNCIINSNYIITGEGVLLDQNNKVISEFK